MCFVETTKMGTNALSQLLSRKQFVGCNHGALAMDPLGLNWVEPGLLVGKKHAGTDALALCFDLGVVLAEPSANDLAHMPGSIIPNEQPGRFPLGLYLVTSPLQELRGNIADRPSRHKAQRHLVADRLLCWPALPQNAVAGECFGVRVSLLPDCSTRCRGCSSSCQACMRGKAKRLHHTSSR